MIARRKIIAEDRIRLGFSSKRTKSSTLRECGIKKYAWVSTTGFPIDIHAFSMYSSTVEVYPLWYDFASIKYVLHRSAHYYSKIEIIIKIEK